MAKNRGRIDVLLGLQWGDEAKGKAIDYLANERAQDGAFFYGAIARFQGGPNSGHTLYHEGKKVVLHTVPSGVLHPHMELLMSAQMVVDPIILMQELRELDGLGIDVRPRLYISDRTIVIDPFDPFLDRAEEASRSGNAVGTTGRGIGRSYAKAKLRIGLKIGDVVNPAIPGWDVLEKSQRDLLKQYETSAGVTVDWKALDERIAAWRESLVELRKLAVVNMTYKVHDMLAQGVNILAEGAQGVMLDVDQGDYPFVTSSNTITGSVMNSLGVSHRELGKVFGVMKTYTTKVGGGPFPSRMPEEEEKRWREAGGEFGATTGRPRMCGYIDLPAMRYALMITGVTEIFVAKSDICESEQVNVVTHYIVDGKETQVVPRQLSAVSGVKTISYPGWKMQPNANTWEAVTPELKNYLNAIIKNFREVSPDAHIIALGTGPDGKAVIDWKE
jgi:adenylosuccinate synthase